MKKAFNRTKLAFSNAASTTEKTGRNALLKNEIHRLKGKIADLKKEFGPKMYDLLDSGSTEAADACFQEYHEKIEALKVEIAKKEEEIEANNVRFAPKPFEPKEKSSSSDDEPAPAPARPPKPAAKPADTSAPVMDPYFAEEDGVASVPPQ